VEFFLQKRGICVTIEKRNGSKTVDFPFNRALNRWY